MTVRITVGNARGRRSGQSGRCTVSPSSLKATIESVFPGETQLSSALDGRDLPDFSAICLARGSLVRARPMECFLYYSAGLELRLQSRIHTLVGVAVCGHYGRINPRVGPRRLMIIYMISGIAEDGLL